MESVIDIVTVILLIAYVVLAIFVVCKCRTVAGSVGAGIGFSCGGFVIISIAEVLATILCWGIVIGVIICILGFLD